MSASEVKSILHGVSLFHLEDARVFYATGDDRLSWIQGQITNDARRMTADQAVYALVLDVKARILADIWLSDQGTHVCGVYSAVAEAALLAHFEHQIIMEDVTLDVRSELEVWTVQGPMANAVLSAQLDGALVYRSNRLGLEGFDVVMDVATRERLLPELQKVAARVSTQSWEVARVLRRRPRFGADFGPDYLPQEAGLKALAISFNKGCYVGQEVVCMLENRGKLRRQLVALEATPIQAAHAGLTLRTEGREGVGVLTTVVQDPGHSNHNHALGYVQSRYAEVGLTVSTPDGTVWTVTALVEAS